MDIKKHFFRKFVFPRILIIDRPGLIVSKNFNNLNSRAHKMRVVYNFEDFYVNLYFDTLKKLGKEKTEKMWYKMGKDLGIRYFLFNGLTSFPFSKVTLALKYFQAMFIMIGMGFCKNLNYNISTKKYIFWGNNNIITRKTKNTSYIEGILAGVLSFITKENLESKGFYDEFSGEGKIIVDKKFPQRYSPDFLSLKIDSRYKFNFYQPNKITSNLHSFSDLLKFKIIQIDEGKKFYFGKYSLLPTEISLIEIIAKTYFDMGEGELFRRSTIKFIKNLCFDIFKNFGDANKKMKFFRNIISAFGFGEIYFRKEGNNIRVDFLNFIFTEFGLYYLKSFINGFVNYFYEGEYSFDFDKNYFSGHKEYFIYKKLK